MAELRTLKEIGKEGLVVPIVPEGVALHREILIAYDKNLRSEAVKWIKELQKQIPSDNHKTGIWDESVGAIKFIKKFFNLTEGDINGE